VGNTEARPHLHLRGVNGGRNKKTDEMHLNAIELNEGFKKALNLLENTSKNVFITGKAGTGKSTFLDYFRNTTKKRAVFLAPTGVAAVNIKGETKEKQSIHFSDLNLISHWIKLKRLNIEKFLIFIAK
jgi:predicted AAA+ superfamily ATPase